MLLACILILLFFLYIRWYFRAAYGLMVMTVGAAETALGLAILVVYYKLRGGISLDLISRLKS